MRPIEPSRPPPGSSSAAVASAPRGEPPGHAPSSSLPEPIIAPRKRVLACLPCSKAKAKCDNTIPCDRCFRKNLTCTQVLPKRGDRKRPPAPLPAPAESREIGKAAVRARVDDRPLVELVLSRTDPGVAAGIFLRTFHQCLAEGNVVRSSVVALLRVWRTWSLASGADVTWGALDAIAQAVQVAPWELEAPEAAGLMELPKAERRRRAEEASASIRRVQGLVPPELEYTRTGIGPDKAMVMSILPSDSDDATGPSHPHSSSPSAPAPSRRPRPPTLAPIQQASNPAYQRFIKTIGDLQGDVVRYRAAQILLLIALVAPQDRDVYFLNFHRAFFTDTPPLNFLFKASYGDGQVRLYLAHLRRIRISDGRVAIVHHIEPCPKSKHITDMPETAFQIVRRFRRDDTNADAGTKAGGDPPPTPPIATTGARFSPPPLPRAPGGIFGRPTATTSAGPHPPSSLSSSSSSSSSISLLSGGALPMPTPPLPIFPPLAAWPAAGPMVNEADVREAMRRAERRLERLVVASATGAGACDATQQPGPSSSFFSSSFSSFSPPPSPSTFFRTSSPSLSSSLSPSASPPPSPPPSFLQQLLLGREAPPRVGLEGVERPPVPPARWAPTTTTTQGTKEGMPVVKRERKMGKDKGRAQRRGLPATAATTAAAPAAAAPAAAPAKPELETPAAPLGVGGTGLSVSPLPSSPGVGMAGVGLLPGGVLSPSVPVWDEGGDAALAAELIGLFEEEGLLEGL